jgi:hypothetical protein
MPYYRQGYRPDGSLQDLPITIFELRKLLINRTPSFHNSWMKGFNSIGESETFILASLLKNLTFQDTKCAYDLHIKLRYSVNVAVKE